jgi:aspartate racemase
MKRIGLIGGIGPESTVDYYRRIIDIFKAKGDGLTYPEILIYSADLAALMRLVDAEAATGCWDRLTDWILTRVAALHAAGAQFVAIGSNTPHVAFDAVRARSPIPLLSIVEATCRHALSLGVRKLGLLGTRFTMTADFYPKVFGRHGMALVVPEPAVRERIQHLLFTEIELGILRDETRQELLAMVRKMIDAHQIEAVILGCTELPLILQEDAFGIPFLNTTAIHVQAIVACCLDQESPSTGSQKKIAPFDSSQGDPRPN